MSAGGYTTTDGEYIDAIKESAVLEELAARKHREFAPVIVYVAIVVFCGFFGNMVTLVYYGFKIPRTNTNAAIATLAVTDALTCIVTSNEIIELWYAVTFSSSVGCRIMYFTNRTFVSSSVLILFFIGIDRFRKICHPFSWQFSLRMTKCCIAGLVIFAVMLSVRDLVIFDIVRVPIENGTAEAFYCTQSNDVQLKPVVTAFQMIDVTIMSAVIVILITLYSKIVRQIFVKHMKATKDELKHEAGEMSSDGGAESVSSTFQQFSFKPTPLVDEKDKIDLKSGTSHCCATSASSSNNASGRLTRHLSSKHIHETSFKDRGLEQAGEKLNSHVHGSLKLQTDRTARKVTHTKRKLRSRMKKLKEARIERQITLMLMAISAAFFISFAPYFVVNLAVKLNSKTNESELSVGIQLALRSYILNSAVNPYIICIFNSGYRRFIVRNVIRCFRSRC